MSPHANPASPRGRAGTPNPNPNPKPNQVPYVLEHPLPDGHRLGQLQRGTRSYPHPHADPDPTPSRTPTQTPSLTRSPDPNPKPKPRPDLPPHPNEVTETVYEGGRETPRWATLPEPNPNLNPNLNPNPNPNPNPTPTLTPNLTQQEVV